MADTKISALPVATTVATTDTLPIVQGGATKQASGILVRGSKSNASVAAVSAGYAADTYLAGSSVLLTTAGAWQVRSTYQCQWDMTKTAAGTAAMTVIVRMGTLGTTGDPAILTLTWGAGTAAADTGWFMLAVTFRTIGAGSSAVIQGVNTCVHHLAATGLISTGASGTGIILGTSAGFDSTTQTFIGVSVNGGASFSGTNTLVQAQVTGF